MSLRVYLHPVPFINCVLTSSALFVLRRRRPANFVGCWRKPESSGVLPFFFRSLMNSLPCCMYRMQSFTMEKFVQQNRRIHHYFRHTTNWMTLYVYAYIFNKLTYAQYILQYNDGSIPSIIRIVSGSVSRFILELCDIVCYELMRTLTTLTCFPHVVASESCEI